MDCKELGNKIRIIRRSRSLSQENVASDLGLSLTGYANIENGKTNVPFKRLCEIASYFNISVATLLEWDESGQSILSVKSNEGIISLHKTSMERITELEKEIAYLKQIISEKDKIIMLLEKKQL